MNQIRYEYVMKYGFTEEDGLKITELLDGPLVYLQAGSLDGLLLNLSSIIGKDVSVEDGIKQMGFFLSNILNIGQRDSDIVAFTVETGDAVSALLNSTKSCIGEIKVVNRDCGTSVFTETINVSPLYKKLVLRKLAKKTI